MIELTIKELIFICYAGKKASSSVLSYFLKLSHATQKARHGSAEIKPEKLKEIAPYIESYLQILKKLDRGNDFVKANSDQITGGIVLAQQILKKIVKD